MIPLNIPRHPLQKGGILLVVACSLNGCSTLQSWFPDKEKDYQFTTELPPLIIPPDLVQKPTLPVRAVPVEPVIAKAIEPNMPKKSVTKTMAPAIESVPESKQINRPTLADPEIELSRNEIQVSLTHENTPTLNLNVPSVRAWRIVGKALSRSNIEVTSRNQDGGQIHIQIADTQPKEEIEKSLWDNTVSVFNPFSTTEQSYVLQFHEANARTTVTVLNPELQPLTDGADNKVLMILFNAIKSDLSK
ncbi:MAG: outer membrane protein assembly factor BamC [Methylococcales bacterium]|nr:outer membrane protein assembly factor BamC [Methylococcales bacterium]MDD5754607.1 outer membrane protein assembly factor BamC [Methylococcales bacterium]